MNSNRFHLNYGNSNQSEYMRNLEDHSDYRMISLNRAEIPSATSYENLRRNNQSNITALNKQLSSHLSRDLVANSQSNSPPGYLEEKKESKDDQINIDELLNCYICLGRIRNAQMCPNCSKLCCEPCIQKWLTEQKSECPHCRAHLRMSKLVNCRFVGEITEALETINQKQQNEQLCTEHNNQMQYFCKNCQKGICSDCAMFGTEHRGHQFQHLTKVYDQHIETIKSEMCFIQTQLKDLNQQMIDVEGCIDRINKNQQEKSNELIVHYDQMQQRLETELKGRLLQIVTHKSQLAEEIQFLQSLQTELNTQIETESQGVMIDKSNELVSMLKEINSKAIPKYDEQQDVQFAFVYERSQRIIEILRSELVPQYRGGVFIITEYKEQRRNLEVIFSDPIVVDGITWRLQVYPNGNGVAKNTYLSIFLEMTKDSIKFYYQGILRAIIILVSRGDAQPIKQKPSSQQVLEEFFRDINQIQFASDFQTGQCWGYNRFYKIDLLEQQGYLDPIKDCVRTNQIYKCQIELKYFVRSPTYFTACNNQKLIIEDLQSENALLKQKLEQISTKLNNQSLSSNSKQTFGDEGNDDLNQKIKTDSSEIDSDSNINGEKQKKTMIYQSKEEVKRTDLTNQAPLQVMVKNTKPDSPSKKQKTKPVIEEIENQFTRNDLFNEEDQNWIKKQLLEQDKEIKRTNFLCGKLSQINDEQKLVAGVALEKDKFEFQSIDSDDMDDQDKQGDENEESDGSSMKRVELENFQNSQSEINSSSDDQLEQIKLRSQLKIELQHQKQLLKIIKYNQDKQKITMFSGSSGKAEQKVEENFDSSTSLQMDPFENLSQIQNQDEDFKETSSIDNFCENVNLQALRGIEIDNFFLQSQAEEQTSNINKNLLPKFNKITNNCVPEQSKGVIQDQNEYQSYLRFIDNQENLLQKDELAAQMHQNILPKKDASSKFE